MLQILKKWLLPSRNSKTIVVRKAKFMKLEVITVKQPEILSKLDKELLNKIDKTPIFVSHISNSELLLHLVMLFFTVNLRMSYIYTRAIFWRYALAVILCGSVAAYRFKWKISIVWLCVFIVMLAQNLVDLLSGGNNQNYKYFLPVWFVIYPTVPLIACSLLENIMLWLISDPELYEFVDTSYSQQFESSSSSSLLSVKKYNRDLKWKLVFVSFFTDKDIRMFYPIMFEILMLIFAVFLPIEGGGIAFRNCTTDVYAVLLWVTFVLSEDHKIQSVRKLKTSRELFKLPSHIVKALYILYAPPLFWVNISFLIAMNVFVSNDIPLRDKILYISLIAMYNILLYTNHSVLATCPLMFF